MAEPTNAVLAQQIADLVTLWNEYTEQFKDWLAGTADGGPEGDGRYPLTDSTGTTYYVPSPAAEAARVDGLADSASAYAVAAGASEVAAGEARTAAEQARDIALSYRDAAVAARDLAETYMQTAGSHAANAKVYRDQAQVSADSTATDSQVAADAAASAEADRIAAEAAAAAAEASAAEAATFDPNNYHTKAQADVRFPILSSGILPSQYLPPVAITETFEAASQSAMLALTAQQGDVCVRSDLNRSYILSAEPASTLGNWVELLTPTDSVLSVAGKTGVVALDTNDIDGLGALALQNTVDWGSQVVNKPSTFAPSAHTHPWGEVTSKPATATRWPAWGEVTSKPSTFAPSAHTHSISDITSLQSTLDAKLDNTWLDRTFLTDSRGAQRPPSYYDGKSAQWDFQSNTDTGAGGDTWTGLLTVYPWSGFNTAHRQQQLAFTGTGGLKFRYATSDSAWAPWQTIWTSVNFDPATKLNKAGDTVTGRLTGTAGNTSGMATSAAWLGAFETQSGSTTAAMISFHRSGAYAAYFGLDTDNKFKVGGWSMGAVAHEIWHAGNDGSGSGLDADMLDGYHVGSADGQIPVRIAGGDLEARLFRATYGDSSTISGAIAYRINNTTNNYTRYCSNPAAVRDWLGAANIAGQAFTGPVGAPRLYAGYDSGVANSVSCSSWFRSSGATGWYNASYAIGIYATDSTYIKAYPVSKSFYAADFVSSSDRRLKTDVRPFTADAPLVPHRFKWKDSGDEDIGFIAQEVEEFYPELVGETEEDGKATKLVSYPRAVIVLAAQVNALRERIAALEEGS